MANILTQEEIDELLKSLNAGVVPEDTEKPEDKKKIVKYDFRLANKFAKEQMKALNTIYENYSRLLSSYLSTTLRVACEVEVVSIEEQKFFEYLNSLPSVELFGIIGMKPLVGSSLIDVSQQIAYAIINRVLGGAVDSIDSSHNYTEIELAIMEKTIKQMLDLLDESWNKIVPIKSKLERIETTPQFAQIVSVNETIAIITMNVKIENVEGFIHFCIPHMSIKPVEKQLSVQTMFSTNEVDNVNKEVSAKEIKDSIMKTRLNLVAKFNTTLSTVQDCLNLQVGDVIMIDHNVNQPINLYVEHMPKFKGKLGIKDSKYAICIKDIYYKEDYEDEWDLISSRN